MMVESLSPRSSWTSLASEPSELTSIPNQTLARILFEIDVINAFERKVIELKDAECVHGPIHISIGQEAVAAAVMATLTSPDRITGSHRAHHHFLAKAINHVAGDWDPATGAAPQAVGEVVRKALSEIMGLADGYCGGRGGSMHLRWGDAGVLGTNAIVSGGVPLSVGAAYADKLRSTGNVVVAFFGDGGVNQGSFHEAANLAALWNLPIIFVIENNQYAVATSVEEASSVADLSQHALAYDMEGRIVKGYDVAAIHQTTRELVDRARSGDGPSILEAKCYRHFHHGGALKGSQFGYRDKDEEREWLERDAFATLPGFLQQAGVLSEEQTDELLATAERLVDEAAVACTTISDGVQIVRPELWPDPATVAEGMRSDGSELADLTYIEPAELVAGLSPNGAGTATGGAHSADGDRNRTPGAVTLKYSDAIAQVTGRWLEREPDVMVLGEEVANFGGGAYGATRDLPGLFPGHVINTPISECGFSGLGLGLAMSGVKTIVEIMFPDFTLVAADQIFNQIGKARHMYGGTTDIPLVLRTRVATGCGYGGQHSMDPVGLYALFSGWRIVAPSDSADYIGLFNTAMRSNDPVLMLEHHSLYTQSFDVPIADNASAAASGTPDLDYCIPFGKARIVKALGPSPNDTITVLTYGAMTQRLLSIAPQLEAARINAEIVDLRTLDLASLDFETCGESLARTGVVAIVEEAAAGQGIGRRIASEMTERFFDELDAPPGVIASMDVPNSVSKALEEAAVISDDQILEQLTLMGRRQWK